MNDFTCSFCHKSDLQTIKLRIGMIDGNWCLGCLATKAFDLDRELTEMKSKMTTISLRGADLLKATKSVSDHNDQLLKENIALQEKQLIREVTEADKK